MTDAMKIRCVTDEHGSHSREIKSKPFWLDSVVVHVEMIPTLWCRTHVFTSCVKSTISRLISAINPSRANKDMLNVCTIGNLSSKKDIVEIASKINSAIISEYHLVQMDETELRPFIARVELRYKHVDATRYEYVHVITITSDESWMRWFIQSLLDSDSSKMKSIIGSAPPQRRLRD